MKRHRTPPRPASSWRMPAGVVAVVAVFALKLVVVLQLQHHPLLTPEAGLDSTAYAALARDVVRGNFALGPGLYFVSPLYVYVLALLLSLNDSLVWVRVAQAALGTLAVVLVFRTAELWRGRRAAWFAGGLAALTGIFTFHETLIVEAALDPLLTALALYALGVALQRFDDGRWPAPAGLAGLAFGALALNRPQMFLAAAGLSVVFLAARRWRTAILFTAGVVLSITPLLIRNYAVSSDLAPASSHGGLSFYVGNNPVADGTHRMVDGIAPSIAGRDDARQVAERAIGRALDDAEVSAHFYGLAWTWILAEPARALRLFVLKLAYAFNAAEPALTQSYRYYVRDEHTLLRYLPVGAWLLVPLGLAGLWLGAPVDPRRHGAFRLWVSSIPLLALSVAAFVVSSRHRAPLLIPLCATAGCALDALARRSSRSSPSSRSIAEEGSSIGSRRGAAAAVVIAGLAVLALWPFSLDEGRAEERTRMALWLIGQERYDEARRRAAEIERGHREPGVLHFRVGRALLSRRQADAAVHHLERAETLEPGKPDVALVLGQALLEARRPREAIPHLRRAVDAGLRPDIAGFDLARAHASAGDRPAALKVLQTVRPARPEDGESWRALGELALQLEAPRLAEAFLRQSVRVAPGSSASHEQLGLAVALGGRYDEAVGVFERAVQLDPRAASAHLNLAVAYAETGRVADARRHAQEALRLDPAYEQARKLLAAITAPPGPPQK